ncbi:MAG: hypothetical protein NT062_30360 [Proteobacteria bacterium]|nr:hypothetical protein [Pseudomonadota bacterium]
MKQFAKLLKVKHRDFHVIKAHADGPKRLFVALEVFEHERDQAASCVIAVDLATLAVEVVHAASGSSVDYVHHAGWHGLLQRGSIIEFGTGKPVVTKASLGKYGTLAVIARAGTPTLVGGSKRKGKYATEGFVASVAKGKLAMRLESSRLTTHEGPIHAIAVGASGTIHAAGDAQDEANQRVLFSGKDTFVVTSASEGEIYALHALADGSVMVGAREAASVVKARKRHALTGVVGRVHGVTTFRGTEYWMSRDGAQQLLLSKRVGAKLTRKYKAKYQYVGYRSLSEGAPEARMTATDDLLIVTNKDRIHVFDGKRWQQLALAPNVDQLVKKLPTGMK